MIVDFPVANSPGGIAYGREVVVPDFVSMSLLLMVVGVIYRLARDSETIFNDLLVSQ